MSFSRTCYGFCKNSQYQTRIISNPFISRQKEATNDLNTVCNILYFLYCRCFICFQKGKKSVYWHFEALYKFIFWPELICLLFTIPTSLNLNVWLFLRFSRALLQIRKFKNFVSIFVKIYFLTQKKRFSNRRRDDKMFSKGSDGGGVRQCAQAAGTWNAKMYQPTIEKIRNW